LDDQNKYFSEQKQRALQKVNQEARIAVSEAMKEGEIGEKMNQSLSRQGVALAEKEARISEYERDREVSESLKELNVARAEYDKMTRIAQIKSVAEAEEHKWFLQMKVEERRKEQELERIRAEKLTAATVKAETDIKDAEGHATSVRIIAEAEFEAKRLEAQGILEIRRAEAEGLHSLIEASGSVDALTKYMMIRDNLLPQLAKEQAQGIKGLNPKISIWNTSGNGQNNLSNTLTDFFKTGMPLFDSIKQQTGLDFMKSAGVVIDEYKTDKK
jgi:flotillin